MATTDITKVPAVSAKKPKKVFSLKKLRVSLRYRPEILKLIIKLRLCIRKKNKLIANYREEKLRQTDIRHCYSQTEGKYFSSESKTEIIDVDQSDQTSGWNIAQDCGETEKSIADQVKEVAQSALAETGMVYVESAGMYYDYKTGYYYNSELGLYYHPDTGCYYCYSDDKKTFVFHSYPDTSQTNKALIKHQQKKAKKHKQDKEKTEDQPVKSKKKKKSKDSEANKEVKTSDNKDVKESEINGKVGSSDLEDGECSVSDEESDNESVASTSTEGDDDTVAKHHPPCMRIIVRETTISKLKVGTLFLITKDGGTIGREGAQHTILLREHNVSRNHLHITYDPTRRAYFATDMGSKNGSILNGNRMSESQEVSVPMEIPHGTTLQLGETKLLCHIHQGNDTCGHCEPGLIMAAEEKEKKTAYTRTCSVQKQHQLELARLKNKYAPEPLAIEDGSYNDRAKQRREVVGSSHEAEKTQQSDLNTSIAPDNKGFKLLQKMGWSKGEGLGKDSQGDTEPIPLVSNETKAGLGAAGSAAPVTVGAIGSVPLKRTIRPKLLKPPAKLFRDPLEDDDD